MVRQHVLSSYPRYAPSLLETMKPVRGQSENCPLPYRCTLVWPLWRSNAEILAEKPSCWIATIHPPVTLAGSPEDLEPASALIPGSITLISRFSVADCNEIFPEYFRIKFRYNPLRHGPLAEELRPKTAEMAKSRANFPCRQGIAGGERFDSSIRFLQRHIL